MNRRSSWAFYVECLLLTIFLLALTTVLVQMFSAARAQALDARRLTDSQRLAQNVSEDFYGATNEEEFLSLVGLDAATTSGGKVECFGPSGESYLLQLELTDQPQAAGSMSTLHLEVCISQGEAICSFDFVRYWPN